MKSLKQYLAESEKTYEFRLRSLNEISDEHMDRIEAHMKKYNMESMGAPKKTLLLNYQRHHTHCMKRLHVFVVAVWAV